MQPQSKVKRPRQAHDRLIRVGIVTYVFALCLIAAFSIAFHFISDSIVARQEATARVVNISGRQRMLSQRIAKLTLERAAKTNFRPDAETRAALADSIQLMTQSEDALLRGSGSARVAAPSEAMVRSIYTSAPWLLKGRIDDFLRNARRLADRPESELTLADPDLIAVQQAAQSPLLNALNAAVIANQSASEMAIHRLRQVLAALTMTMLLILLLEAMLLYRPLFRRLAAANRELVLAGRTDPLTGCLNRRAFTQEAQRAVLDAKQTGQPVSVLMIDIDRFKPINDQYGHAVGDLVINEVVHVLVDCIRADDVLCRMGGEEFAVLLPHDALPAADLVAERLRTAVAAHAIAVERNGFLQDLRVTVSVGAASLLPGEENLFHALGRADKGLYRAKVNGRNRTECEYTEGAPTATVTGLYKHRSRV